MQVRELNDKYSTTNVRWGIVRNKNLSEQLDSATVVLTDVSSMDIEPYDLIQLTNESGINVENWLIANVNKDYVTYKEPFKFDYTLDLMSLTKWLETIPLPSMSITNIGQNRTIKSYIQRVIERYVLPELSEYVSTASYTGLDSRFDAVCPEMSFSQTTAREYLDWMVGNFGCVIKIEYVDDNDGGKIDVGVLDLNNLAETVPNQYINDIKEIQSGAEYVTQFDHNLQDVIGQEPITEYVTIKGDGYVFNSENAVAILSHKPYDILKVVVKTSLTIHKEESYNSGTHSISEHVVNNIDLTKYFVTEEEFKSLDFRVGAGTTEIGERIEIRCTEGDNPYFPQKGKKYQRNSMYWNRGNNKLSNINTTQEVTRVFGSGYTMEAICAAVIWKWLETNWKEPVFSGGTNYRDEDYWITDYSWSDLLLEVTYIPYISPRLLVEQKDNFSHLVTMQDNSTNTQTELGKFLSYSLEKNSKLGNPSKIITGMSKVENGDYTPKFAVGQIWRDEINSKYVLSNLEYTIFKNSILYKGTLTKNYTNRILNTLINREKRYYSLPDPSEVVDRKEVTKEWVKIQVVNPNSSETTTTASELLEKPLFAFFIATFKDNNGAVGTIYVDSVYGGNLISHNVTFEDNISYATSVSDLTVGGYKMNIEKYVDDDGELESLKFRFGKASGVNKDYLFKNLSVGSLGLTGYQFLWQSYTINLLKDSRERISWSLERIFYSDNSDIKLGNNFAELFKDKTKRVYLSFIYSSDGIIQESNTPITVNEFLTSNSWSSLLTGTSGILYHTDATGILYVKESNKPNANIYLTINNFDTGDYLVFTTGSKRG